MILLGVVGLSSVSWTQMPYFNDWIRPQQSYVKLLLAQDGLYRVSKADLLAAGVTNLQNLNASNLQLFYRGEEVPVIAHDSIGAGLNYFEFIGRANDGELDSLLFRNSSNPFNHDPSQQGNRFHSLFNDTSAYFLTWDNANAQRYTPVATGNVSGHLPLPYFRYRSLLEFRDGDFNGGGGATDVNNVLNPDYITGEGPTSREELDRNSSPDAIARFFPTPGFANSGNPSRVEARVLATNNCPEHIFAIDIDRVDRYRDTTAYINIGTFSFDYNLPLNASSIFRFHVYGTNTTIPDKQRMIWLKMEYDRKFDLNGQNEVVLRQWNQSDSSHVRIYNSDFDSTAWIFDPSRKERIQATVGGDTLHFLIPGDASERELYFFTDKSVRSVVEIDPHPSLHNLSGVQDGAEFIILTHRRFANSAQEYANYRDTCTVNQLKTRVVFVDQIFDEFGYGSFTPWAIKNFCRYALENWPIKPKHFLIWGKGRDDHYWDSRDDYVPTFGYPANDWEYVTNMSYESTNLVPAAGMGRVSIYNDAQGMDYLRKVMDYEHQAYDPIYKDVLMMGGGKTSGEQASIFDANIDKLMPYFVADPLNANVYWYQKRNSNFQSNTSLTTDQHINQGLGILHYFGHSATNIFELDIQEPGNYTNWHKYPFMLAFGCSGGNFAEQTSSYGERMILQPERGGIAFLGNTSSGFIQPMRDYAKELYRVMFQEQYGASLGEIFQATIEDYFNGYNGPNNIYAQNHIKQLNLQGDPSIHLNFPRTPDLRISSPDIYFLEDVPQALATSFDMGIIVHNDGRSFSDSFAIRIVQRLPSGLLVTHDTIYQQPFGNTDTLLISLPNPQGLNSAGINTFTVTLDPDNRIPESEDLSNNSATITQLFLGNLAKPLHPAEYAIVGATTLKLQASAFLMNLPSPLNYSFEIDTVASFDSPFRRASPVIAGAAAMGEWPIGFNMSPNQVYYWRVRLSDHYPAQWIESSFKYIPNQTGWSQSQSAQMTKDIATNLRLDLVNRMWEFGKRESILHAVIKSSGSLSAKATYFLGTYGSDGDAESGVLYTSINAKTLVPRTRKTIRGDWWLTVAPSATSPSGVMEVAQYINETPEGDYFLLASSSNPNMKDWPDEAIRSFELVGATYSDIRAMDADDRLIIFGQKGASPGTATVIIQPNIQVENGFPQHDLLRTLSGYHTEGALSSTLLGPSANWGRFSFDWSSLDLYGGDSLQVSVYGVGYNSIETLLMPDLAMGLHQLDQIDAAQYPYLRLKAQLKDAQSYTAPQLRRWEAFYPAAPDLVVDASHGIGLPDSLVEGQLLKLWAVVSNITDIPTDSIDLRVALQFGDRRVVELGTQRYGAFSPREFKRIAFTANTAGYDFVAGEATLIVEVNPLRTPVEQYHFNNLYQHPIRILTDERGPLVDVTIDGKHLMAGDIVSPEPEIVIQINDENPYLPVTVSDSTYRIWFGTERSYLTNQRIMIEGNDSIDKSPVRMPDNKSRLTFRPGKLADGEYTLAVQGYDLDGNAASARPYVIQLNVVNEKAISEVLPYPNPFSTACHFAYTLTGNEKPERFEIEIFTITGKLVKVIDLLALGEVHFGRNITQYAWDGHDEFGDALANGVYIYKITTRFSMGADVQLRDEGISTYFKNGFGKMYLMR